MGYLTVLYVGLGAKIGDLHAKDSHSFCNKQINLNTFTWHLFPSGRTAMGMDLATRKSNSNFTVCSTSPIQPIVQPYDLIAKHFSSNFFFQDFSR